MIREAGPDDRAEIEAILMARIDQAMFPLVNLREHGLGWDDVPTPHDHAIRVWRTGNSLIAVTRAGMILPLLDGAPDLSGLRTALDGLTVTGAVGPAASARPVLAVLGLDKVPMRLDADEPGFSLALSDLRHDPGTAFRLESLADRHRNLAEAWRAAAKVETEGMTEDEARRRAVGDIDDWIDADSHRLLLHHGQPVAMTGFNASLPEIVQVGGVYTPVDLRGRGYARHAVALHLAEARGKGTARAVLFAANDAAARAYRAIGFRRAEDFTLFLLSTPIRITA